MRDVLHWLPISQRIHYRITALVSRCVLRCDPSYLRDLCCLLSVLAARRVLRSAARGELLVSRARLAIMQWRAFSVVGPSAWISLLSCVPCWWPPLPNFTSPSSPSSLAVTGLGAPLSSSVLKRRYISLPNEWMNSANELMQVFDIRNRRVHCYNWEEIERLSTLKVKQTSFRVKVCSDIKIKITQIL